MLRQLRGLLLAIAATTLFATGLLFAPAPFAAVPATEVRPVTDTLHGEQVTDNYRWLEGDNSDPDNMGRLTEEVAHWTDQQNAYTRNLLDQLPGRAAGKGSSDGSAAAPNCSAKWPSMAVRASTQSAAKNP